MQTRRIRPVGRGALALGLVVAGAVCSAPVAMADPLCGFDSSDFDHDYRSDQVIGIPGGPGRDGAVQVRLSNDGGDPVTVTIPGQPGFGTAVTVLSSYTDAGDEALCSQLVVGSPDETNGTLLKAGAVYVFAYNRDTQQFDRRSVFAPQQQGVGGAAQAGARFGATLAAQQRAGEFGEYSDSRRTRLYVGSPGYNAAPSATPVR